MDNDNKLEKIGQIFSRCIVRDVASVIYVFIVALQERHKDDFPT